MRPPLDAKLCERCVLHMLLVYGPMSATACQPILRRSFAESVLPIIIAIHAGSTVCQPNSRRSFAEGVLPIIMAKHAGRL
jgi:hypothetical protein